MKLNSPSEHRQNRSRNRVTRVLLIVGIMAAATGGTPGPALALITGGSDDREHAPEGWPKGAAAVFNSKSRIAYWEGPPFGGGQWHSECRGTTAQLQQVLNDFAKIEGTSRKLILKDGVGNSFWLNPNHEPPKTQASEIDWVFMVWQKDRWQRLQRLPTGIRPSTSNPPETEPAATLTVYTGGSRIDWSQVTVPSTVTVDDQRLVAHGFSVKDGVVAEGQIQTLEGTGLSATVRLERIMHSDSGGYDYETARSLSTDADGHWVMTRLPAGSFRIIATAAQRVPRIIEYVEITQQPRWYSFTTQLALQAKAEGRVLDSDRNPLREATVHFRDVEATTGGSYRSPLGFSVTTDAAGRFRFDQLPRGRARASASKAGYVLRGLGTTIDVPTSDIELILEPAGELIVTVDFQNTPRPKEYLVEIEPEGGAQVGSWGGSGRINDMNQLTFRSIPSGKYIVHGRPNPGSKSQQSSIVKLTIEGGKVQAVTLQTR